MSETEHFTDVVELCALLQCLGFTVKSLDTSDGNVSQDLGTRTIVVNCQASGFHVVLESNSATCSCPPHNNQNSGFWQVSGVAGGKQSGKESGSTLLGSLPKIYRERFSQELREMVRCIKEHNESDVGKIKEKDGYNKSASMVELTSPDKRHLQIKADTPTRYRSLDTLTSTKDESQTLPTPGLLQKQHKDLSVEECKADAKEIVQMMCRRQSTYTIASTPGSVRRRNKTSSPIQPSQHSLLDSLIIAEKAAEDLRNKLLFIIKEFRDEEKNDSSMSSLALDVSKISVLKAADTSKTQFVSSPNLGATRALEAKSKLRRYESASTSNLSSTKQTANDGKASKLRHMSPNMFKSKDKSQDGRSKLASLFKPRIVTPVRIPKLNPEASPNLSSSKKKYSHIKSTIPRLSSKKE